MTGVEAPERTDAEELGDPRGEFGSLGSIVGLLALTWGAALASRPLNDNSFFTHLATGRLILEDGRVPTRDPYTFTASGEPWTVQSWLASVAYASFERLAGTVGLRLLVLLVFLAATWVLWRLSRPATSVVARLAIVSSALLVASGLWSERPYMIGVIGLGLVWLALEDEVSWWWVLPLMWVWGNSHGSFLLAPALVAAVVAGGMLDRGRRWWRDVPASERRTAAAVAGGCVLVTVGPLGLRALTFPLVAARRGDVFRHVTEWQAPTFRSASELAYLGLLVVSVVVLARWGRSWRLLLPAAAFVAGSLYAQRNVVSSVVILVAVLSRVAPSVGTLRTRDRPALGRPVAAITSALLVLVLLSTLMAPARALDDYAVRPLAWLDVTASEPSRVASDVLTGNLLTVLDGPAAEAFIDDRFDMVPDDVFEDYLTLRAAGPDWWMVLDERDVGLVVWSARAPLASALRADDRWRTAYADGDWIIACRRETRC